MNKRRPIGTVDEIHVELDERYDIVVERLMDQNGRCRDTIGKEYELGFFCYRDGAFYISRKDIPYHLQGRCTRNGSKTDISAYVCYDKSHNFFTTLTIVIVLFYLAITVYVAFFDGSPIIPIVFACLAGVTVLVADLIRVKKLKPPSPDQLPEIVFVMKDEVLKRIDAIKCWNE